MSWMFFGFRSPLTLPPQYQSPFRIRVKPPLTSSRPSGTVGTLKADLGFSACRSLQPLLHVYFQNQLLRIVSNQSPTRSNLPLTQHQNRPILLSRLARSTVADSRSVRFDVSVTFPHRTDTLNYIAVIGRVVSSALSDTMSHLLRENDGVLQLLFNSMIEEHLMEARARLDISAQQRPAVARIFRHVGRMSSTSSWGGLIRDTVDAVNSLATIIVQISVLRSLTTRENRSYLALSSLGFLTTLRWLFRSRR